MEVEIKVSPSHEGLTGNLKQEFSKEYSYGLFGLGSEKSVFVRKSAFVGAQITKKENGLAIQSCFPLTVINWFFSLVLSLYASGAMLMWTSSYKKLEKEIALFLKERDH